MSIISIVTLIVILVLLVLIIFNVPVSQKMVNILLLIIAGLVVLSGAGVSVRI